MFTMGLIYEINLDETGLSRLFTFTDTAAIASKACLSKSVAGLKQIEGTEDVKVEVTWSPAWKITKSSRYGRGCPVCHPVNTLSKSLQTISMSACRPQVPRA